MSTETAQIQSPRPKERPFHPFGLGRMAVLVDDHASWEKWFMHFIMLYGGRMAAIKRLSSFKCSGTKTAKMWGFEIKEVVDCFDTMSEGGRPLPDFLKDNKIDWPAIRLDKPESSQPRLL